MEKITTPDQLYELMCELYGVNGEPAWRMMSLLADQLLQPDEWSIFTICALDADGDFTAKLVEGGIHLRSRRSFARRFKARVSVTMPLSAFEPFSDMGEGKVHFLPSGLYSKAKE